MKPKKGAMKVYDFPLSPNSKKVRAVSYELGLQPEFIRVDLFKGEQKSPEILALNPNGRVPILVDGDFVLWESNAIVAYLANGTPLLPSTPRERAEVDRWSAWQLAHIGPAIRKVAFQRVVKPLTGQGAPDQKIVDEGTAEFSDFARMLDGSLGRKEYVAGRLSIADFILGAVFGIGVTAGLETKPYGNVDAWLSRVMSRASMKRALADAQMPKIPT